MPVCRQNVNATREVTAEIRNRVAVRTRLRDAVTLEAFSPEIRAPDMICVRHVSNAETVKAKRDEDAFPRLPCGFAYRSNRAVADARTERVWIEWNKHALTCSMPPFLHKKRTCTYQMHVRFISSFYHPRFAVFSFAGIRHCNKCGDAKTQQKSFRRQDRPV